MKIKELKQGDHFVQNLNDTTVRFEVLAIQQLGRHFQITFRSALGIDSARYPGEAMVCAA